MRKSALQEIRDLVKEHGTPEDYKNYLEYEKKLDAAHANSRPFIICSPKLAEVLNQLNNQSTK